MCVWYFLHLLTEDRNRLKSFRKEHAKGGTTIVRFSSGVHVSFLRRLFEFTSALSRKGNLLVSHQHGLTAVQAPRRNRSQMRHIFVCVGIDSDEAGTRLVLFPFNLIFPLDLFGCHAPDRSTLLCSRRLTERHSSGRGDFSRLRSASSCPSFPSPSERLSSAATHPTQPFSVLSLPLSVFAFWLSVASVLSLGYFVRLCLWLSLTLSQRGRVGKPFGLCGWCRWLVV